MSDPSLLDNVLILATCIFFCLWVRAKMILHTDHNYIAMRYAVFMLREPDRTAFLNLWVKGHGTDIADRFPGFEIYREQYERAGHDTSGKPFASPFRSGKGDGSKR